MIFLRISFLLLGLSLAAQAQRYYPTAVQSRELLALGLGTTAFYGDIPASAPFSSSPHISLSYEYKVFSRLGLRLTGSWYRLAAHDAGSENIYLQRRNLSFSASNLELSVLAAAYALPWQPVYFKNRSRFNASVLFGIGFTYFNPKAELDGQHWNLRSLETEGVAYGKTSLVVPFGGSIQTRLLPQLDLSLQLTYHYSLSDYLDDVSTVYKSADSFEDPVAARLADRRPELGLTHEQEGAIRGNPQVKDSYAMLSLRVQYHLMRYRYLGKEIKKIYQ